MFLSFMCSERRCTSTTIPIAWNCFHFVIGWFYRNVDYCCPSLISWGVWMIRSSNLDRMFWNHLFYIALSFNVPSLLPEVRELNLILLNFYQLCCPSVVVFIICVIGQLDGGMSSCSDEAGPHIRISSQFRHFVSSFRPAPNNLQGQTVSPSNHPKGKKMR